MAQVGEIFQIPGSGVRPVSVVAVTDPDQHEGHIVFLVPLLPLHRRTKRMKVCIDAKDNNCLKFDVWVDYRGALPVSLVELGDRLRNGKVQSVGVLCPCALKTVVRGALASKDVRGRIRDVIKSQGIGRLLDAPSPAACSECVNLRAGTTGEGPLCGRTGRAVTATTVACFWGETQPAR